jgi:hypothetical protein
VDFSGFILFDMTLKVDEERQQLFPFCAFFYHFAAQTAV